jgi:hypothetical protein
MVTTHRDGYIFFRSSDASTVSKRLAIHLPFSSLVKMIRSRGSLHLYFVTLFFIIFLR